MPTETVAVLFTDWVGSTEVLSRLGEERTEALRRELYRLVRTGASRHGGREVKNVGDGLMLVYPSASECIAGAIAIQQAIAAFNVRADEPLAVRIGGSIGDADVAENDYFGVAVVEAARLCAAADGHDILVTEHLRAFARGRVGEVYEYVGELELKGLPEPAPTFRVTWTTTADRGTSIPYPVRLHRRGGANFVGRAIEVEAIGVALKRAIEGNVGGVVLVSGEAGIGKTSLITEVTDRAFEEGAVVLYGSCDEELGVPYQPWREALGHLVEHADPEMLEVHAAARGGDVLPLLPHLQDRVREPLAARSDDPETRRYLLFAAAFDLLTRAASSVPVVLVLDDLHWADRTTVQLLRHVAGSVDQHRLLVIGAFRDTDLSASHPMTDLLAALHREASVDRLTMRGLDDVELASLIEQVIGSEAEARRLGLRDALARETDGNPFFAQEILRHLAETEALTTRDSGRPGYELDGVGLPVSVREVVGRRVARLGAETQRLLSTAAVIGREFDLALLALVVEMDDDALLDLLEPAVRASVLAEVPERPDAYAFVHALIPHTLYEELGTARRRRLHRRVAEMLEASGRSTDEQVVADLARHWYQATRPEDGEKALLYAMRAGAQAERRLAPDEAVLWYSRALELGDDAAGAVDRTECLIRLGTNQRLAGIGEYRSTLLEAARTAREQSDAPRLVRAALANFRGVFSIAGDVDRERIEVLDLALRELGDGDHEARVRLLARLAIETYFSPDHSAGDFIDEALSLSVGLVDDTRLDALVALMLNYAPGTLDRRLSLLPEFLDLTERSHDPARGFWARWAALLAWVQSSELGRARATLVELEATADEVGDPAMQWISAMSAQLFSTVEGDFEQAVEGAQRAMQQGLDGGQLDALLIGGAQLATVPFLRGEWGRAIEILGAILDEPHPRIVEIALAGVLLEDGRSDEARRMLPSIAAAEIRSMAARDPLAGIALLTLAVAAPLLPPDTRAELAAVLQEIPGQLLISGANAYWPTELAAALVLAADGRHDEASEQFAAARRRGEALALPLFGVWADWRWAEMLHCRGRPDERSRVSTLALRAAETAAELGMPAIRARCEELQAASRPD